jgi:hypothetical protein
MIDGRASIHNRTSANSRSRIYDCASTDKRPGAYICERTNGRSVVHNRRERATFFRDCRFDLFAAGVVANGDEKARVSAQELLPIVKHADYEVVLLLLFYVVQKANLLPLPAR